MHESWSGGRRRLGPAESYRRLQAVQDAEAASPGKASWGLSLAPTHFPARLPWDDEQLNSVAQPRLSKVQPPGIPSLFPFLPKLLTQESLV